jgi:DNA polymerase (family 10)
VNGKVRGLLDRLREFRIQRWVLIMRGDRRSAFALTMTNEEIACRLAQFATLLEINGEDQHRIRSYRSAAEVIEFWPTPLREIAAEEGVEGLRALPGIGKAISAKIIDLLQGGTFDAWEKLIAATPVTTLDLLLVDGIGVGIARTLHRRFKISSIEDLRLFTEGGGLELVDGIGEKTADRIRAGLKRNF